MPLCINFKRLCLMWDSLVTWLRAVASGSFASGCRYFSFFPTRPAHSGGNPAFCPVVAEGCAVGGHEAYDSFVSTVTVVIIRAVSLA